MYTVKKSKYTGLEQSHELIFNRIKGFLSLLRRGAEVQEDQDGLVEIASFFLPKQSIFVDTPGHRSRHVSMLVATDAATTSRLVLGDAAKDAASLVVLILSLRSDNQARYLD